MIRAYELMGRPVITVDEGVIVGETAGVIIDTASTDVAALIVNVIGSAVRADTGDWR